MTRKIFILFVIMIISEATVMHTQSSIFFVPSTDTQEKKTVYFEADFFAHFDSYDKGGFQSYGPSVVYGLTKNVEIGFNYYYTRDGVAAASELQPNIKWKAYDNEDSGVAVAVGTVAFIPLNDAAGDKTSVMIYGNASKTFASANDLRLTGGIYRVLNTEDGFGTKTGALVGLEQPLTKKFSFSPTGQAAKTDLAIRTSLLATKSTNLSIWQLVTLSAIPDAATISCQFFMGLRFNVSRPQTHRD